MIKKALTLVLTLCGLLGCSREAQKRSEKDSSIGKWTGEKTEFLSEQGHLHVLNGTDEAILLRASTSQFKATIKNLAGEERTVELTLTNIFPGLIPDFEGVEATEVDTTDNRTLKKYTLKLAPDSTGTLSAAFESVQDFTFLAMGDIQNGIEKIDKVIEKLKLFQEEVDFLLFLGDATMRAGEEEFDEVVEALDKAKIPIYLTPGNHDVSSFGLFQNYFGKANYSFVHKGVRFTSLDTADGGMSRSTWDRYSKWLKAGSESPHLIFSHITPKDIFGIRGGHWRSRREAHAFLGHAAKYGVDAMFFGHLHTLDQYRLAGIPVVVSGGAGAFEEALDGINRHFVKVVAQPSKSHFLVTPIRVD